MADEHSDELPPLTAEQIAAMDEGSLSAQEQAAIVRWWHTMIEDRAHGGKAALLDAAGARNVSAR